LQISPGGRTVRESLFVHEAVSLEEKGPQLMRIKCERVEQITVTLENRPGILADLCAHLSDRRINIRAIAALDTGDADSARLVVDNVGFTREVLSEAGVPYRIAECLAIEMPNDPGGFASLARTLSLAGINIDYIYASGLPDASKALGIFGVSDLERALTLDWGT
jgi:hypothetical protein